MGKVSLILLIYPILMYKIYKEQKDKQWPGTNTLKTRIPSGKDL